MKSRKALEWLLEEDQPSARYLTLTTLQSRAEKDSEVESARRAIAKTGWAAEILSKQSAAGWWVG